MSDSSDQRRAPGATTTKAKAPEVSIARLPATNRELFGREAEFLWLDACWREGVHVASIVAWGGVGKSALVNKWLANLRDEGWRGAERVYAWSFYSQGTDRLGSSDEFVARALKDFGDPEPTQGSPWDKGERLARLVKKERTLLVLDGVEPMQWGPGVQEGRFRDPALEVLLKELGGQNEGLCLVSTRIELTDLDGSSGNKVRTKKLDDLSSEAGARLLQERGAKGTDEELRKASDEYKGHGLALTLLGSYLGEVAEGDIRRRKEIGPLEEDERFGGHAKRVMAAYERMFQGKPELAILRMLGLFDRPADEGEVGAVTNTLPAIFGLTDALERIGKVGWDRAISRLRRVWLLAPPTDDKRLDAHPLVREHFGEQLQKEQSEAWREGHRRLYEHLKKVASPFPETIEEMALLYAAVVHGCLAKKSQEAFVEIYWERIQREEEHFNANQLGAFGSELAVLSATFDHLWDRLAPGLSETLEAYVLNAAGLALQALGRLEEAAGPMRMGLNWRIAQKDWKNAAIVASNLSELLRTRGELSEALAEARNGIDLADKSGNTFRRMAERGTFAAVLHSMGLREKAALQFEEAELMQKERQPAYPLLFSGAGFRYCDLLLDEGRDADVREHLAKTMEWAKAHTTLLDIAHDNLSLGRAHVLAAQNGTGGDLAKADNYLKQAVDGLRRAGRQDELPLGLLARAALHTHTRAFADARRDLDEALTLATRCGFRLHKADAHLGHARLCLAEERPADAGGHLAKARRIIDETGYHRRDGELATLEAEAAEMAKNIPPPAPPLSPPAPSPAKAMTNPTAPQPVDFLLFAPLEEERDALLSKLPGYRKLDSDGTDVHVYFEAEIATRRQDKAVYRVLVTSPAGMGPIHAAVTASAVTARWKPEHVIVVGIAGGLKDEVSLGDVMVARSVADYTVGKVEDGAREERWESYPADIALLNAANTFRTGWADLATVPRPEGTDTPARHAGVIASGGDVIASKDLIAAYRKDMPKLIGVEMEGGGVATALHSQRQRPRFLMIRGVSDLADGDGNATMKKLWRAYARDVAAAYTVGLLRDGPVPAVVLQNPR